MGEFVTFDNVSLRARQPACASLETGSARSLTLGYGGFAAPPEDPTTSVIDT